MDHHPRVLCAICGQALTREQRRHKTAQFCSYACRNKARARYPNHATRNRIWQANYRRKLRDLVFAAYGGYCCACCGETTVAFLTIDHMGGGGTRHREAVKAPRFFAWLKRHGFPPGYQVLCFNCNCGRARNGGVCPHREVRDAVA